MILFCTSVLDCFYLIHLVNGYVSVPKESTLFKIIIYLKPFIYLFIYLFNHSQRWTVRNIFNNAAVNILIHALDFTYVTLSVRESVQV